MNSEVFKQSNYRDSMFDSWLQALNENFKNLNAHDAKNYRSQPVENGF